MLSTSNLPAVTNLTDACYYLDLRSEVQPISHEDLDLIVGAAAHISPADFNGTQVITPSGYEGSNAPFYATWNNGEAHWISAYGASYGSQEMNEAMLKCFKKSYKDEFKEVKDAIKTLNKGMRK